VKDESWEFVAALNECGGHWTRLGSYCGRKSKLETIVCYAKFFTFPLGLILSRKRFDKILAWQQFYGLNYAFFQRLFHLKKRSGLYVMTFIYKPKQGLKGRLYAAYMNYIVKSRYIDKLICFSSSECDYYKKLFGIDRFVYVPLGIEAMDIDKSEVSDDGYLFSTGRSNRDYKFLIEAMVGSKRHLHIACGQWQYEGDLPHNVELLHKCYGKDMAREMSHCHCVVIPLKDLNISAGQLVILQAMQLGKPIIVTRSKGVVDYIEDGVNGLLMDNTKESLMACLDRLEDKEIYNKLATANNLRFSKQHTLTAMARNIYKIINV